MKIFIIINILILTGISFASELYAYGYETIVLQTNSFTIPKYAENTRTKINDIGIDSKNGNLCFATNSSWGDMPFKNGKIDFEKGFMAPTKGFRLVAMGGSEKDMAVIDMVSRSLMDGRIGEYSLPDKIKRPSGLAYHKKSIYITDRSSGLLYKIKLRGKRLEIINKYPVIPGVTGLDSDGKDLYICDSEKIYRLNGDMLIDRVYKIKGNKQISGIVKTADHEFFAPSDEKNIIYKLFK